LFNCSPSCHKFPFSMTIDLLWYLVMIFDLHNIIVQYEEINFIHYFWEPYLEIVYQSLSIFEYVSTVEIYMILI
jgi:hypothetical protein